MVWVWGFALPQTTKTFMKIFKINVKLFITLCKLTHFFMVPFCCSVIGSVLNRMVL